MKPVYFLHSLRFSFFSTLTRCPSFRFIVTCSSSQILLIGEAFSQLLLCLTSELQFVYCQVLLLSSSSFVWWSSWFLLQLVGWYLWDGLYVLRRYPIDSVGLVYSRIFQSTLHTGASVLGSRRSACLLWLWPIFLVYYIYLQISSLHHIVVLYSLLSHPVTLSLLVLPRDSACRLHLLVCFCVLSLCFDFLCPCSAVVKYCLLVFTFPSLAQGFDRDPSLMFLSFLMRFRLILNILSYLYARNRLSGGIRFL